MPAVGELLDPSRWEELPFLFAYTIVLAAALWLVWRLLLTVERLVAGRRPAAEPGPKSDQASQLDTPNLEDDPPA